MPFGFPDLFLTSIQDTNGKFNCTTPPRLLALASKTGVLLILIGILLKHIRSGLTTAHCMMGEHPQLGSDQQST